MKLQWFLLMVVSLFCADLSWSQTYEEDTDLASKYYAKGVELKNKYDLDSAEFYLNAAAELFKKHEVWENYLIVSNEAGAIFLARGEVDQAVAFFNVQINIAKEKFGESNEYLANLFNNLGRAYFYKGDAFAALDLYDKSLAIRISMGDKESIFVSNLFNDMGNAYTEQGEFDLALDYYQKSLDIRKKVLGEMHPETALSYNNLGIIFKEQAQYDKAIEYHQKAIEIQKKIFGEDYPELANYYQGIGNAYKDKMELDQAMEYYQKAYSIRKKAYSEKHPLVAKDIINIATIYSEMGDFENALSYFQNALSIQKQTLGEGHPDMAITYNNLGNIYEKDGQHDLALAFYLNALDIKKTLVGEMHPDIADYYTNIGNIYSAKNDKEQALDYHQKALAIKTQFYGQKHPAVVLPYLNIGQIYYEQMDYSNALANYQKSLSANVKNFNPEVTNTYANPIIANYYNAQSLLSSLQGKAKALVGKYKQSKVEQDLMTAYSCYVKCDSVINIIRRTSTSKTDKIEFGKISSKIYDEAIDVCFKLNQLQKNRMGSTYLKQGFYFSEKNKAGVLLEALAASEAKKFAGIPDSLLEKEKKLKNQVAALEKRLAETYDEKSELVIRGELFNVNRKYDKLIGDFEANYPAYHEMKYNKASLTIEQLQSTMDSETAIRGYFIGDSMISIFTVTKDKIFMDKSVIDDAFDLQIFSFRRAITSNSLSDVKQYLKDAYKYYQLLFPTALPDNIKRLVIIPDGNLGLIPFEALLTEEYTGRPEQFNKYPYLIKKYEISYNYSASLYFSQLSKDMTGKNNGGWLGIAPVFSNVSNLVINENYISPLPATEAEINTIKKEMEAKNHVSITKLFTEASEAYLKSNEVKGFKYLHIASHGFVNSEKPELSGIVLAQNHTGGNDGVLYTGEIYNMELNSDLVVLSACETGLGKVSKGEGIIGLSRALLYAGTNNIIVSLWKVADESTSELMIDFYDYLLNAEAQTNTVYSSSLHATKLEMVNSKKFSHPFFWSPFILIGE
jgi:CHAT domain-containing protein/Tfp pilus assembly protein PilF